MNQESSLRQRSHKVFRAEDATELEQIPNIGKAIAADLILLGITKPSQLKKQNGIKLYKRLCDETGVRHDPCVADTFMAAVDFMNGGKARPWWDFTEKRKKLLS